MPAAALDTRFVLAPSLQEFFIDKNTALPMTGGIITWYSNTNRNVKKNVYQIQQALPSDPITYVELPNPTILSGVGTVMDADGNDVLPYYFPYEGDPVNSTGEVELYYIIVTDENTGAQLTRFAFPNISATNNSNDFIVEENFVPNGQFLLHNDQNAEVKTTFDYGSGVITEVYPIAQGGWTFERSQGSTATDVISFQQNLAFTPTPSENPRYSVHLQRTGVFSDVVADLRIKWMDVNKFYNPNQNFTFIFNAVSNSGNVATNINLIQYFGSGGTTSATVTTVQGSTQTITPINTQFQIPIIFPPTSGLSIGTDDTDFIQIAINFQPTATFDVILTDFMLIQTTNTQSIPNPVDFSVGTNGEYLLAALSNIAPTTNGSEIAPSYVQYYPSDGSDLYLPLVKTLEGMTPDYSQVGQIVPVIYPENTAYPLLSCDGSSYVSSAYSTLGIPYTRLRNVLLKSNITNTNIPLYGTGTNYNTAYIFNGDTSILRITSNLKGSVTPIGAGTSGLTALTNYVGNATLKFNAYNYIANNIIAVGTFATALALANAGTSGFTVTAIAATSNISPGHFSFVLAAVSAAALTNTGGVGRYFTFSNDVASYYMWFQVTNETDPAPGGTGIHVVLPPSATAQDVVNIVREVLTGLTVSQITLVSGAGMVAGSYFTFASNLPIPNFYVWYKVQNVGSDPAPGGSTGIEVDILTADTAAQVAAKTQLAINSYQFATPDLRGMFLRGLDPAGTYDIDVTARWSTISGLSGANAGTFEFEQFLLHNHPGSTVTLNVNNNDGGNGFIESQGISTPTATPVFPLTITGEGGHEVRPVNAAVNWFIKY